MYTAFYGLREKPFALSPDPRFLYLAGSHREALAHLLYGIEQGEGFISVTGEVGTGKTTLCRTLLERLEGNVELAFLFNPSRSALELLQSICAEFGLPAEGLARRALMAQLNQFLLEKKREGRRVLLIIDEAQTLSNNTLEQVRLLSNLETASEKLIQILLLGQPELDRKLDTPELRQLRQRISVRWQLAPLQSVETAAYVNHRLAVAAGEPKALFSEAALREVHRRTGGLPRLVNQLCDRALLGGYAARAAEIGPRLVKSAAREIPDTQRARRRPARATSGDELGRVRPWLMFVGMGALVAAGLVAGLQVGRGGLREATSWLPFVNASSERPVASALESSTSTPPVAAARPRVDAPPPELARLRGPVAPEVLVSLERAAPGAGFAALADDFATGPPMLAPGTLESLLADRAPERALAATERALLDRYGRWISGARPAPQDAAALAENLEARGLVVSGFSDVAFAALTKLDHPAALALAPRPGDPTRWVALLEVEPDGRHLRLGGLTDGRVLRVERDEVAAHWTKRGMIAWERFEPLPPVLNPGDRGDEVRWLQEVLEELGHLAGPSRLIEDGQFEAATVRALRDFQREQGLDVDGSAGPLTQIALYGQLERYPVPRLSESGSAVSSPARADADADPNVAGERG